MELSRTQYSQEFWDHPFKFIKESGVTLYSGPLGQDNTASSLRG